jgi:hypothetical protein
LRLEDVGDGEGEKVVHHKDMWSRRDYDHEGFGAVVKKLNGYGTSLLFVLGLIEGVIEMGMGKRACC